MWTTWVWAENAPREYSRRSFARFERIARLSRELRSGLRELHLAPLAGDENAFLAVATIELPASRSAEKFAARLEKEGFLLGYASAYLRNRNWIQICLMGEYSRADIRHVLRALQRNLK